MAKVNVHCAVPSGITIRLYKESDSRNPLEPTNMPNGDPITLKPGINEVDRDFFEEWLHQNKNLSIVTEGLVYDADKKDDKQPEPQTQE